MRSATDIAEARDSLTSRLAALRETGGIWFGWSGETPEAAPPMPKVFRTGNITYIQTDLSTANHDRYYSGFANRTLWPLFHYRLDLCSFERDWYSAYRRVNQQFAEQLSKPGRFFHRIAVGAFHCL